MDTGDGVSHIVPIYKVLLCITPSSVWNPAEYSMKNLTEQGYSLTAAAESEFARDVKEKLCYTASDYDTVLTSTHRKRQGECHGLVSDGDGSLSRNMTINAGLGILRSIFVLLSELYFHCMRLCFQRSKSKQQLVNLGWNSVCVTCTSTLYGRHLTGKLGRQ